MPCLGMQVYLEALLGARSMPPYQPGEQLDHYRIESLASQTAMSCVYRATDLRNGREVAIKVPSFEAESDPLFHDRFKREEEIGRKLSHSGVIKGLHDEERSRMYMVMEWAEGRTCWRSSTTA